MSWIIKVVIGDGRHPVGELRFESGGGREASVFTYDASWLASPARFAIDPALPLRPGPFFKSSKGQPGKRNASPFFGSIADTEPDGWARRIILRDAEKRRQEGGTKQQEAGVENPAKPPVKGKGKTKDTPTMRSLTSLDFLLSVDDASRIGALRFQDAEGHFQRAPEPGKRTASPLIELRDLLNAAQAVERNTETAKDLRFLMGRGTSLDGMRPKCSVIDDDGSLAIGKFPSIDDQKAVTKGEVLALRLAKLARINAAEAKLVHADGSPVTIVKRFDREGAKRLMFISAMSMLGIEDDDEHAYTEVAEAMVQNCQHATRDMNELWRRIVYSVLITNVDDHLRNHGFLHVGGDKWRLSPAYDINPAPEKQRVLKTWISEDTGPEASIGHAMRAAKYFRLDREQARAVLAEVSSAVGQWRAVAKSVGMTAAEVDQFEEAFEHSERTATTTELRTLVSAGSLQPPRGKSRRRDDNKGQAGGLKP